MPTRFIRPVYTAWGSLLFGITLWFHSCNAQEAMNPLEEYKWKNRPLLLFAPSETHPDFEKQLERLNASSKGVKERELIVIQVLSEEAKIGEKPLDEGTAVALRERFSPQEDALTIVLIGKDGAEKLRQQDKLSVSRLFQTIDAMPMRQQEIREGRN